MTGKRRAVGFMASCGFQWPALMLYLIGWVVFLGALSGLLVGRLTSFNGWCLFAFVAILVLRLMSFLSVGGTVRNFDPFRAVQHTQSSRDAPCSEYR